MRLFESAVFLGTSIELGADTRPQRLRDLRDAMHPTCPYYRFLYELGKQFGPLDVIEIGTYVGTSAAHFAESGGDVITIDINPDAKRQVDALGYPNIVAMTGDSLRVIEKPFSERYDVLYIDGLHNFSQAHREYFHYRQLVREGGLMIFDDVNLEMDGDEMNVLWDAIPEPKHRLDHLHTTTGFGIVEKTRMSVTDPATAYDLAAPIIKSRQRRA